MTSQTVFLDLDQPWLEGIQFLSFSQLLSKEMKIQREPPVSPWGVCIQWAREVVGGSWVRPVLLEWCVVGHRAPDVSLQYASGLFLVVCTDPVKI